MDTGREIAAARRTAGLSQRALAERARTSQAAISAYEAGRKDPSARTVSRLLAACGRRLAVVEAPGSRTSADLERRAAELAEVLALAEALPFRRPGPLRYPRLPA